jgi:predicted Fe-Mo cluster-binding NifX family protein
MKIAISSAGKEITDNISDVFARCPYFIIAEIKDGKVQKTEFMENKIANQLGQAGIAAAQLMAEKDIEAVITKNVGPRALDTLNQFNIDIYVGEGTIEKGLREFVDGKIKKIN